MLLRIRNKLGVLRVGIGVALVLVVLVLKVRGNLKRPRSVEALHTEDV